MSTEETLFQNFSIFINSLLDGNNDPPFWMNEVVYAGLFNETTPKTVWAIKMLKDKYVIDWS